MRQNTHRERFLYEYDFCDLWQHQIRFERKHPVETKRTYPVCVDGARCTPPEDCGGPQAYMELLDHHQWNWPHEELLLMADTLTRLLNVKEDKHILVLGTWMSCKRRSRALRRTIASNQINSIGEK